MSNTKFTPGPWNVGKLYLNRTKEHIPVNAPFGTIVITTPKIKKATEEDWANARLIAVAPEMYELIELFQHIPAIYGDAVLKAKVENILNKANLTR